MASSGINELIKNVETLLSKTKDVGQVFAPFCKLVDAVLDSSEDKYAKVLDDLFGQIESRLKWNQKDADKVQKRLDFYRVMAKAYKSEKLKNVHGALKCYNKILRKTIVTITSRNYDKYRRQLYDEFDEARDIIMENVQLDQFFWDKLDPEYNETVKMIMDRFDTHNLPKDMELYDTVLESYAGHLNLKGHAQESLEIEKKRLASIIKVIPTTTGADHTSYFLSLPGYYYKIASLYSDLGQRKNCLKTCAVILEHYKKIGDLSRCSQHSRYSNLVLFYVRTLHYQAISLAKLGSPDAAKAISNLQMFMRDDPMAKKYSEILPHDYVLPRLQAVLEPYVTDEVFNEDQLLKGIPQKIEEGKNLYDQRRYLEAYQKFELAAIANKVHDGVTHIWNKLETALWSSKCLCNLGRHLEAVGHLQPWVDHLQRRKLRLPVTVTRGDVYEALAKCLFHIGYYEESLDYFRKAMKFPDKPHLLRNYAQLLICSNKLKKASNFVDINRQVFDDDQAVLIYHLSRSMQKVDEILLYSASSSPLLNYIQMQRWREQGATDWAVELLENKGLPINPFGYVMMYFEIGHGCKFENMLNGLVQDDDMEKGCETLTKMSLENLNQGDSAKFQKLLVKTLKRDTTTANESYKEDLLSWSKSVSISLFVQKKLKLRRLQEPFCMFEL